MSNTHTQIFPTSAALSYGAAEKISAALSAAHIRGGIVSLALSGGSTPRGVYEALATAAYRKKIDWSRLHIFWGDERCVPPESSESNYRMAHQAFLRDVPLPAHHIHRIRGELTPAEAARAYEIELRNTFGITGTEIPRLSLVLLGVGEDGHTASLFPGSTALHETRRLVTEVYVERLNTWRVTLTYPMLGNAEMILFLVSGPAKAPIARAVIHDGKTEFPATHVALNGREVEWYIDRDAASLFDDPEHA